MRSGKHQSEDKARPTAPELKVPDVRHSIQADIECLFGECIDLLKEKALIYLSLFFVQILKTVEATNVSGAARAAVTRLHLCTARAAIFIEATALIRPLFEVKDRDIVVLGELLLLASHIKPCLAATQKLVVAIKQFNLLFGLAYLFDAGKCIRADAAILVVECQASAPRMAPCGKAGAAQRYFNLTDGIAEEPMSDTGNSTLLPPTPMPCSPPADRGRGRTLGRISRSRWAGRFCCRYCW
jgi:hypothetical protein